MSQKPLFDPGPADGTLTARQRLVLTHLRAHPGLSADEAGAILHAHAGKHPAEQRCAWCAKNGRQVLHALRHKKLVKQQRGVGWRALHGEERAAITGALLDSCSICGEACAGPYCAAHDPATAPFPLGF